MSVRGTPAVTHGSEQVTARRRWPRPTTEGPDGTSAGEWNGCSPMRGWRCSPVAPGRNATDAQFREVSSSDSSTCPAGLFSSIPDSLYRRAL